MQMRYLLHSTFRQILCRKMSFVLSVILLGITYLIIIYQALIVAVFCYQSYMTGKLLKEDRADVYLLDLRKYTVPTEEAVSLSSLGIAMKSVDGVKYAGVSYEADGMIPAVDEKVMAISGELDILCGLQNIAGETVAFGEAEQEKTLPGQWRDTDMSQIRIPVLAGYALRERYPVGYEFSGQDSRVTYVVTDILQKDSKWFSGRFGFGESDVDLDDCLVVDEDAGMMYTDENLTGLAAFVFVTEHGADIDRISQKLVDLAGTYGLDLYGVQSVKEILADSKKEVFADTAEYGLIIMMLVLAVAVAFITSLINVYLKKKSIGILYAVGYCKRDVQVMILLENVIKVGMAFMAACAYWSVNAASLYGDIEMPVFEFILPWLLVGTAVIIVICSILPIRRLSKIYPAALIGGRE